MTKAELQFEKLDNHFFKQSVFKKDGGLKTSKKVRRVLQVFFVWWGVT